MRKRQLFYDLLLFSSVLGVTLTSQVQLSHHSTFNFSTTAKADTTSDSDTGVTAEITKYSDMDNVLSLTGTSAKEDQDNRIANLTSIATMLETNANKISSTMMMDDVGFKTLKTDYAYSVDAQKSSLSSSNAKWAPKMLWKNTVTDASAMYAIPTPTDIAALYYNNLSVIAIKEAQINASDMSDDAKSEALSKVDAFKTTYKSLTAFGETFIGKTGTPSKFAQATQPKDIDAITNPDTRADAAKNMVTANLNSISGTASMAKNKIVNISSNQVATAKSKIDTLAAYYTNVLDNSNATNTMATAVNKTWSPAFYAINSSATSDASAIPATSIEKLAAVKLLNAYANDRLQSLLKSLNLTTTTPTASQQQVIDGVKDKVKEALASSVAKVNAATTVQDLQKAATNAHSDGYTAIYRAGYTAITAADVTADEKIVDDAAAAQIKLLQADKKATAAQIAAQVDQVNKQVTATKATLAKDQYKEIADTHANAAKLSIQSYVVIHADGTTSATSGSDSGSTSGTTSGSDSSSTGSSSTDSSSTSGKDSSSTDSSTDSSKTSTSSSSSKTSSNTDIVTAAQKTNAINALISAGNTQKLAIQDDTSLTDAEKTAAYAAIDKLVSSYQTNLNAATNQEAFLAAQIGGLTAVNNYKAGSSSSDKTAVTTPSDTATTTATTTTSTTPTTSSKGTKVVYATTRLKMYSDAGLTKHTVTYAKHARTNRPEFTVFQTKTNDNGTKVYYVRNTASGRKGYISASSKYTSYAYYQTGAKKIKVISKSGVNAYKKSNLSSKKYHYKKGATLKIKKIVKSGLTTRFQLTNGTYVSANKIFVYTIA